MSGPGGKLSNNMVSFLLSQAENTIGFELNVKFTPIFMQSGSNNVGVLYIYGNDYLDWMR